MPTAESSALEITTGMSMRAAMSSRAEIPPSGATLSTAMSAARAWTTASGSSALRMLSSAAIGTSGMSGRRRSSASSPTVAHGCSRYSSGPSALSARAARAASSTLQPPLASTRTVGTKSRTAFTRATSSARVWPGSATLTLAVRAPGKRASTSGTAAGGTAGTVALIGIRSRRTGGAGR
ncbi:hypothetical protein PICSAR107_04145 [Mycobacterium avium subsp. paratuberculosis]|nr:hypothetical protein PICSAR107_04145 [Mycobacterium avium subsp. paratuberculosis]